MRMKNQTFLVVGAGRSGIAAAVFLAKEGAQVYITDQKKSEDMHVIDKGLKKYPNIVTIWGHEPDLDLIKPDYLIPSPGVALFTPLLREALAKNIQILGELELAYQAAIAPFIAITGTNGKTTTTALIGQLFQDRGRKVLVGGNIGLPLIEHVKDFNNQDLIIAEVSSFQLETINKFKPRYAVILNLTPDHLDRHLTIESYRLAKANIFKNQDEEDFLVLNYDDSSVRDLAGSAKSQVLFFSRQHILKEGVYLLEKQVVIDIGEGPIPICPLQDIYLKGGHNLENIMAAVAVGYMMGLKPTEIKETLKTFRGVVHRLEYVTKINGVKYINDSKGTNPAASIKALESFEEPLILIAGGRNKGNDFTEFAIKIKEKVRELVLIGEAASDIEKAVRAQGFTAYHHVSTFTEAVSKANQLAREGELVLLSPGCASWDMFESFEQRGDIFKELVYSLKD